ncbi:SRPBCC family protein [Actinomadura macrotermitis]|uniref:Polyketide cyclase / dehydrase and lipid transport n=1 Tax=Actinomadura macrotermitis TaxID=2585200 RepID=A0A7K0BLG1_9ACTN|nr:hypothetical protein [Actinomadura macrotermitis]
MNRLFAAKSITVDAPADELFELVSDPVTMAGFAEEAMAARWLDGATRAALGARFVGFNRNGWRRWQTHCRIIALEQGRRFAYDVSVPVLKVPISRWQYKIEPAGDGTCIVTESNWARVPVWFIPFAMLVTGVINRPGHNAANIATTLERLKAHAESRAAR